ncbi:MAG: hypothetical protein AAGJ87_11970 [Pseudomonadota bacterium]
MAFGKKGLAAAGVQPQGYAYTDQTAKALQGAAGGGYRVAGSRFLQMLGGVFFLGCAAVIWQSYFGGGFYLEEDGFVGLIIFLGALALAASGFASVVLGKGNFIADNSGIAYEAITGDSHIRWEDLDGFTIMSVNFNKIIYATRLKGTKETSSRQVMIPTKAFKSKELEFLTLTAANRPDLLPYFATVMKKVGAKKLLREQTIFSVR